MMKGSKSDFCFLSLLILHIVVSNCYRLTVWLELLLYQEQVNISIRFNDIPVYDQPNRLSQRKPATLLRQI
jgi:hypothetical protein